MTGDGVTVLRYNGHPVSLFPFVGGTMMRQPRARALAKAGDLLARVHSRLVGCTPGDRPRSGVSIIGEPDVELPDDLVDPELESWHASLDESAEPRGLIHGDFDGPEPPGKARPDHRVLDWDEANRGDPGQEVGVGGLGVRGRGRRDHRRRVRRRSCAYVRGGGAVTGFDASAVRFIRWRLLRRCGSS